MPVLSDGPVSLGGYVRALRTERCMTLRDLSQKVGVPRSSLSRLEAGAYVGRVYADLGVLDALCVALGGDCNELLRLSLKCPTCRATGSLGVAKR